MEHADNKSSWIKDCSQKAVFKYGLTVLDAKTVH